MLDVFNNGREIFLLAEKEEPPEDVPPPKGTFLEQILMPNIPKGEQVRAMFEA